MYIHDETQPCRTNDIRFFLLEIYLYRHKTADSNTVCMRDIRLSLHRNQSDRTICLSRSDVMFSWQNLYFCEKMEIIAQTIETIAAMVFIGSMVKTDDHIPKRHAIMT